MTGEDDYFSPEARRARREARRGPSYRQVRTTPVRITEDGQRSWKPEEKATDQQMNAVLEIMIRRVSAEQSDIADELAASMDMTLGYARAATSAALLYFRQAGWVEVESESGRSVVWRLAG